MSGCLRVDFFGINFIGWIFVFFLKIKNRVWSNNKMFKLKGVEVMKFYKKIWWKRFIVIIVKGKKFGNKGKKVIYDCNFF